MVEPRKDDKKPYAFWLVENFLPHDEESEEQSTMSDARFYSILALAAVIIGVAGMLIRGCAL